MLRNGEIKMVSVYIKTYGCQMNKRDSEALASELVRLGYRLADSEEGADVVLLNTCSVRDGAEQKAIGKMQMSIGQARVRQQRKVFGFLGCAAQARQEDLLRVAPGTQLVLGTHRYQRLAEYLEELLRGRVKSVIDCGGMDEKPVFMGLHLRGLSSFGSSGSGGQRLLSATEGKEGVQRVEIPTAYVNIMHGCNQHCTYCIVPETRGHEFSRPIEEIVEECRMLVHSGVKEVTLLGQIVTSYGRREIPVSAEGDTPFVQLLDAIHGIEGLERVRFTAPHPKGYGADLVKAYGRLPKLCESAHIPVQSGSDRILKAMHRGYTVERFLEIISQLRAVQPGIGIATDIIVGFPGETEEDFEATMALVREVRFDNVFLFKFSPRQHTLAAVMGDQVPVEVREERHARLLGLVNELARESYQALVGHEVEVLVEGKSSRNANRLQGRSRCNKIVLVEGPSEWIGTIRRFRVVRSGHYSLYGESV